MNIFRKNILVREVKDRLAQGESAVGSGSGMNATQGPLGIYGSPLSTPLTAGSTGGFWQNPIGAGVGIGQAGNTAPTYQARNAQNIQLPIYGVRPGHTITFHFDGQVWAPVNATIPQQAKKNNNVNEVPFTLEEIVKASEEIEKMEKSIQETVD